MTDPHATDVLALLDRLVTQERECGRLRAQLEFHLRLQAVAEDAPVSTPTPTLVRMPPREPRRLRAKGELEALVVTALAKNGTLTTRGLAAAVDASDETVRTCLVRLIRQGKAHRMGRGGYGLAPTQEEA